MGDGTGIEWTDATWNPIRGCSRVSEGCRNCYAEKVAARFSGEGQPYEGLVTIGEKGARWNGTTRIVPDRLADPLRWKRPRRVFVNSMSDLFHESVAFEDIAAIFGVMAACPHLTFQVLTKRPERAREFFAWIGESAAEMHACIGAPPEGVDERSGFCAMFVDDQPIGATREQWRAAASAPWPLPNLWLGVSVEDQRTADERIPVLLELPAALRFVSYEPALGPVDFTRIRISDSCHEDVLGDGEWRGEPGAPPGLDWIIVGGESGPGARPFDLAWARSTIEQCRDAGTKCFVKQLGARPVDSVIRWIDPDGHALGTIHHRKGADMAEWPEDLRVREMP